VPIFLCCAEENEVALVATVAELRSQGLEPEVVPGVELDAAILARAVDRNLGAGLYVLCQSDDLDRFQFRRLEGLFSARKGPVHRLITVELEYKNPTGIVPEIAAAADALEAGEAEERPDDDAPEANHLRDVVGARYADDRPRRAPTRSEQPSRSKPHRSSGRTPTHRRPMSHASERSRPVPGESTESARVPDLEELAAQAAPPPAAPAPSQAGVAPEPDAPEKIEDPPAPVQQAPQPRAGSRGSPLVWMGLGGLVVLIAAGIALVQDRGPFGGSAERSAPRLSPAVTDRSVDATPTEGKSTHIQKTGTETDTEDLPPVPQPLEEPPPPPDPSRPGPDEDTLVAAAIAEGKIRALDLLIFVPPRRGNVMEWKEAADYCRAKVVGGVRHFRLPSVREVRKIRKARMLPAGDYWTGTLTAGDRESVFVLDTSLRSVAPWHKSEEATPICVRTK
jgi:hypothetical protein